MRHYVDVALLLKHHYVAYSKKLCNPRERLLVGGGDHSLNHYS